MSLLPLLLQRNSASRLQEPAPDEGQLRQLFQAALRAPDHGQLRPWRFLVITGESRHKLGQLFVDVQQPQTDEQIQKLMAKPLRAPMIIVVIARTQDHPKIPVIEQQYSSACAAMNILLAAEALGFAGIWRTGGMAYDARVQKALGLEAGEGITGFLYLGTRVGEPKALPVLDPGVFVQDW